MAGFIENTIYFSEPYHPYAWPPEYALTCEADIVALGVFGNTLVVLTKRGPEYVSGDAPSGMSKVRLESNEVCRSPRSVVPVSGGVVFASQNGLCMATQQGVLNMTDKLWTSNEWFGLEPERFICEEKAGVLYVGHEGGVLLGALHIPSGKLVRMDLQVTALYSDFQTGELFAALPPASGQRAGFIHLMHGAGSRTARWRSKRIVLQAETGFAWLAVEGAQTVATPLRVDIYGYYMDGDTEVEVKLDTAKSDATYSAVVTDTAPIRVGVGRYKNFEVEIRGQCRVTSVQLVSSTNELKGVA